MLWFKHKNDLRRRPEMLRAEQRLGEVAYGRFGKICEIVSQHGGIGASFQPRLDLNGPAADYDWLASELGIPTRELKKTLRVFAEVALIDAESLGNDIVSVAMLAESLDEFTQRGKKEGRKRLEKPWSQSGATPDSIPSQSEARTDSVGSESGIEVEVDIEKEKDQTRPTRESGLDGRISNSLSEAFHRATGRTLSYSDAEKEALAALRKERGDGLVWKAWNLFLNRSAGFEELHHPISAFIKEFQQHAVLVRRSIAEEERRRTELSPEGQRLYEQIGVRAQ